MPRLVRIVVAGLVAASLAVAAPAFAQKADAAPKPDTYICPTATGGAVDCFLQAVEHLYTMCRQVKSIEIIEFGYEKSDEGVNGAKSEYCVDKHKVSITRPYQAALREATPSRPAVDTLRTLYDTWLKAIADLKWKPGESDDQYKTRIAAPYEVFRERAVFIRTAMTTTRETGVASSRTATTGGKAKPAAAKTAAAGPAKSGN
jgi:hypothetical protein